jgi:iron complex transport system substrate-binding protein
MVTSSRARRLPRFLIGAALSLAVVLSGCSSPATSTTTDGDSNCLGSSTALGELTIANNPKTVVGPSTACLANAHITPAVENPKPALPVTVTDNQGTSVTVSDVSRILTLDIYGSLSATVFGLGLGANVVGRDTSTGFPEAADLPLVTQNGHEVNGEAVLDLQPSVIITDTSIGPWDVILQLRDAGIPVIVVSPERNLNNIDDLVTTVAASLGVPDAGVALNAKISTELENEQQAITAIAPSAEDQKLRILFLYVRGNAGIYYIFGEGSGADNLIQSLGGIDVAGEIGWKGMRPMTAEALVKAAPDVILMMSKGLDSVDGVDGLLERVPAVAQTPAGQNRRIVDMSDTEILSFGPRAPGVLDALARAIYAPEVSGPADPDGSTGK